MGASLPELRRGALHKKGCYAGIGTEAVPGAAALRKAMIHGKTRLFLTDTEPVAVASGSNTAPRTLHSTLCAKAAQG